MIGINTLRKILILIESDKSFTKDEREKIKKEIDQRSYVYRVKPKKKYSKYKQQTTLKSRDYYFHNRVLEIIEEFFGVENINTNISRYDDVTIPKRVLVYFIRSNIYDSWQNLALYAGWECHATAMHHYRKIDNWISINDYETMNIINALKPRIDAIAAQYKSGKHMINGNEKPYVFNKKKK